MSGSIGITSKLGEGTTFRVSVPISVSQGRETGNSGIRADSLRPNTSNLAVNQVRVLVAMDYKYNLNQAVQFFERLNCEVETAESPQEFTQKFTNNVLNQFGAMFLPERLKD
jgi:hypothetical protein